jgi:hypothetical protein
MAKRVVKKSIVTSYLEKMQNVAGRDAIKVLGPISEAEAKYYQNLK